MKTPVPPPACLQVMQQRLLENSGPQRAAQIFSSVSLAKDPEYHPWEWFLRHEPPAGFTQEEQWVAVRSHRQKTACALPFEMKDGKPFTYNLPEKLLRSVEEITAQTRDPKELDLKSTNLLTPKSFLLSTLVEEAIASSQLEGATTSRQRAKEMLQKGQPASNRSERMILNNYLTMQKIRDLKDRELTSELIAEIHRRVTAQTLDDETDSGHIQTEDDQRVRIYGTQGEEQVLHLPPPAEDLPARLEKLCEFANADVTSNPYMPTVLRAFTLHFMMGYDHYFADGNGRTSRAVFYWYMLRQGFTLTEYLSISRLLHGAPAQYSRAFLLTEQDEGDLTYFFLHQARVLERSIEEMRHYLQRKAQEAKQDLLVDDEYSLNVRQRALLRSLKNGSTTSITVRSHQNQFGVAEQTARTDLQKLEKAGYLESSMYGRQVVWRPTVTFREK